MNTHSCTNAPLPRLQTLHTKPSWHNRASNIDRSACFVITAAQLWKQLHPDDWTYRYPARQPAYHAKGKCDRYATRTLYARDLWQLHKWQQPYPLQGDFRSAKSNAMRLKLKVKRMRGSMLQKTTPHSPSQLSLPHINPNRGVGFNHHKMLGLDCLWQTTLRLERYVQHAKLKQHFLVCPVCGPRNDGSSGAAIAVCQSAQPNRTTLGGTSPPANTHRAKLPGELPGKLPGGRVTKLYLPLCSPQEYEDAQLAQLWLKTHHHPNRPLTPEAIQLINRYGELFEPRHLRCRQCLGLRYGEVKAHQPAQRPRVQSSIKNHPSSMTTEQSLFLTNLPKLLANPEQSRRAPLADIPIPAASPPEATQRQRAAPSNQPSISNHPSNPIDALSPEIKEQLLLALASSLPAFKKLEKVKQLTR